MMRIGLLLAAAGMFFIGSGGGLATVVAGMVLSRRRAERLCAHPASIRERWRFSLSHAGAGHRHSGIFRALAGIVGLFAMGFLFEGVGWRAPFFVLGAGMLAGWVLFAFLPAARADRPVLQSGMIGLPWPV